MPPSRSTVEGVSRHPLRAMLLVLLALQAAPAEEPLPGLIGPALRDDPVLAGLVNGALASRPELAQARAAAAAAFERVPQVNALPDPVVSLGIQNDGFKSIQIGRMESSYLSAMASQTFPWRGKRRLRTTALTLAGQQTQTTLERVDLTVRAEVERAWVDLLLARDRLGLLARLEVLWTQAEGLARVRYETGDGAQSDLLRAQLERGRLRQQRAVLAAEIRRRVAVLSRLSGMALTDTLAAGRSLREMADPVLPELAAAVADAEVRSPELRQGNLAVEESQALVELARKDYLPDLTVNAGLMPRWGSFGPMWQTGVSFSVPLWTGSKQSRAVEETRLRGTASERGVEAVRQVLGQRVEERLAILSALLENNRLYRTGILVQSEATVTSTVEQYQVGRVTFASVLEALAGYVSDIGGFYESVAAAWRVDIALREVSLEPVADPTGGGMGGSPMPGAGSPSRGAAAGSGSTSPAPETAAGSMSRM